MKLLSLTLNGRSMAAPGTLQTGWTFHSRPHNAE